MIILGHGDIPEEGRMMLKVCWTGTEEIGVR
jgi:hypothetical protein